jgi:hypothetical protein
VVSGHKADIVTCPLSADFVAEVGDDGSWRLQSLLELTACHPLPRNRRSDTTAAEN